MWPPGTTVSVPRMVRPLFKVDFGDMDPCVALSWYNTSSLRYTIYNIRLLKAENWGIMWPPGTTVFVPRMVRRPRHKVYFGDIHALS